MIAHSFSRLALLGLGLVLAGCNKSGSGRRPAAHPLPPSPLVSKSEPGESGGRLVIALASSPRTFNPFAGFYGQSDAITRLLFAGLINLHGVTQEAGPGLAESWSVAADQKTWTFRLRQGLRWSDGQPLTASDVVFTWNEVMYNPALHNAEFNRIATEIFHVNGRPFEVSKTDDLTIRVVTPEVYAPFLEFFGGVPVLPRHTLAGAAKAKQFAAAYGPGTPPDKIAASGPYRLKEFRSGKSVLLEANPEYWVTDQRGSRLPYFDEIIFPISGGPGSEQFLFLQGKSDVYESVRPEEFDQFKQGTGSGRFQLVDLGVGMERDFLVFNQNTGTNAAGKPLVNPTKLKWFREAKFRQAISCAIDRERIAREVYQGRAQAIYSFLSVENQKWNNPNVARFGFELARAKSLLAQIGIQDRKGDGSLTDAEGNAVEFVLQSNRGNPFREKAAAMIYQDLLTLGLRVTHESIDFAALVMKINETFDYECALMGLGAGGVDPASQMNVLKSTDEMHQWFPFQKSPASEWEARVDALMDAQMRTLDFAQRKKAFDEVQAILAEQTPMIYTVSPASYSAIRAGVGNLHPSVLTPYHLTWNLEELYFKNK